MRQGDLGLGDVGVAGAAGQFRLEGRGAAALGGALEAELQLRLEAEAGAVGGLEGGGDGDRLVVGFGGEVQAGAEHGAGGGGRFAAGRVEDEFGAVDVGADVAEVDGDAVDDVGDRVRAGASTKTSAVSGLIFRAKRTTTVPRSKGPTLAAVIETMRGRSRGRGRPGRSCRGRRRGRSRRRLRPGCGRLRDGGRAGGVGFLFGAAVGLRSLGLGGGDLGVGAVAGRRPACRARPAAA